MIVRGGVEGISVLEESEILVCYVAGTAACGAVWGNRATALEDITVTSDR